MEEDPALQLIITNSQAFFTQITSSVEDNKTTYMDAIIDYCEKNEIEIETVAKLVKSNPTLKALLKNEGESLNFLKKTSKLPL